LHLLAFGLGAGLAPVAPGTFGTLIAVPAWWLVSGWPPVWQAGLILVMFVLGIPLCGYSARRLGVHDHPGIVWDEVVGYFVTMLAAPAGWSWMIVGFVAFRAFDILKPWPIRVLDRRLRGGFGIMVDDVAAGVAAAAVVFVAAAVWTHLG
jgi:phosphatidylglycerophosphatase A